MHNRLVGNWGLAAGRSDRVQLFGAGPHVSLPGLEGPNRPLRRQPKLRRRRLARFLFTLDPLDLRVEAAPALLRVALAAASACDEEPRHAEVAAARP